MLDAPSVCEAGAGWQGPQTRNRGEGASGRIRTEKETLLFLPETVAQSLCGRRKPISVSLFPRHLFMSQRGGSSTLWFPSAGWSASHFAGRRPIAPWAYKHLSFKALRGFAHLTGGTELRPFGPLARFVGTWRWAEQIPRAEAGGGEPRRTRTFPASATLCGTSAFAGARSKPSSSGLCTRGTARWRRFRAVESGTSHFKGSPRNRPRTGASLPQKAKRAAL